jgi:hypothetical protein
VSGSRNEEERRAAAIAYLKAALPPLTLEQRWLILSNRMRYGWRRFLLEHVVGTIVKGVLSVLAMTAFVGLVWVPGIQWSGGGRVEWFYPEVGTIAVVAFVILLALGKLTRVIPKTWP